MNICNNCYYMTKNIYHFKNHKCITKTFRCNECLKFFVSKYSLDRHKKNSCKNNKVLCLERELELEKKKHDKPKKTSKRTSKEPNVLINNNNTNNYNYTNTNNYNNNQNINITVNNYNNPDLSHISNQEFYSLLKNVERVENTYAKIFELIYFNELRPQNHSIYCSNLRSNKIYVFENNKFRPMYLHEFRDYVETTFEEYIVVLMNNLTDYIEDKDQIIKDKTNEVMDVFDDICKDRDTEKVFNTIHLRTHDLRNIVKNSKKLKDLN